MSYSACQCWPTKGELTRALKTSHVRLLLIHGFYIALFSALEQTHCALVACDSECVTFTARFEYPPK